MVKVAFQHTLTVFNHHEDIKTASINYIEHCSKVKHIGRIEFLKSFTGISDQSSKKKYPFIWY